MTDTETAKDVEEVRYSYDEAVELAGHGRYNYLMLMTCSLISNAVALDMFGFGVVLAAASCDLQLSIARIGFLASTPFAGIFFAFPWGFYADTQGRRRALLWACAVGSLLAAISSFSPNWQVMLVLKVVGFSFSTSAYSLTMAYLGECTGNKHRSKYLFITNSFNLLAEAVAFTMAYLILPLTFNFSISWLSITYRPWRLLTLTMALPLGVGALLLLFLYESPKFLANKGENAKALEVLQNIFKVNGGKREDYQVQVLENNQAEKNKTSFWETMCKQTVPIFKPPLLRTTLLLFYLLVICCSTNNVFTLWYPTIVNSFFTAASSGVVKEQNFCDRVVSNLTTVSVEEGDVFCNDTISNHTVYSGIIYGFFFTSANLIVAKLAAWRRLVFVTVLLVAAISAALVNLPREPITSIILFTLIQGTAIGIGVVASYCVDLYPTSYRGLVTSLGMMTGRVGSLIGVNIIGTAIMSDCGMTFYCWSAFVFSGVAVALLLPSDKK